MLRLIPQGSVALCDLAMEEQARDLVKRTERETGTSVAEERKMDEERWRLGVFLEGDGVVRGCGRSYLQCALLVVIIIYVSRRAAPAKVCERSPKKQKDQRPRSNIN
jgi:hypothetical protein